MAVKLFFAKILNGKFEGHIEIQHFPYAFPLSEKRVYIHCFNCWDGVKLFNIPENDICVKYDKTLQDNLEKWDFCYIPPSQPLIINFALRYEFHNSWTGKQEEYWDNNDGKDYTIASNSKDIPALVLGKSAIALYDWTVSSIKDPSGGWHNRLTNLSFYVKDILSHKDTGLHHNSRYDLNHWEDTRPDWSTWITDFPQAKNGEELWKFQPPFYNFEAPFEFDLYYSLNDAPPFYDNNFGSNYSVEYVGSIPPSPACNSC